MRFFYFLGGTVVAAVVTLGVYRFIQITFPKLYPGDGTQTPVEERKENDNG